jgi:hypothetical protein
LQMIVVDYKATVSDDLQIVNLMEL